ncbi:MAG: hypothetical protein ABI679_04730 [Gemmatimonadota bacterium]
MNSGRNGWISGATTGTLAVLLLCGCSERERPTFPTGSGIGVGPEVTVTDPIADTTLTSGATLLIGGTVVDEEGVDTVFFSTVGTQSELPPLGAGGATRVRFSFPLEVTGTPGDTIIFIVYGANVNHVRGDLVRRLIAIR